MDTRMGWRIERTLILFIIVMTILDFLGFLTPFWAYTMDLVAWSSIAYLIYLLSPSNLLFGDPDPAWDLAIVIAYIGMSVKALIGQAHATLPWLYTQASTYLSFLPSDKAVGLPFPVSQDEFLRAASGTLPRIAELATFASKQLTMHAQGITVLLITPDGAHMAIDAQATGLNGVMLQFYNTVLEQATAIQTIGLVAGILLLAVASVMLAKNHKISRRSMLSVIGEDGARSMRHALPAFFILLSFFVVVFNLLFEWMTITNDAPLLIAVLAVLIGSLVIKHRSIHPDTLLDGAFEWIERAYTNVITLLTARTTVLLGITGFLVLHLVTDIGNFVLPMMLGWYRTLYTTDVVTHMNLLQMFLATRTGILSQDLLLGFAYLLSAAGLIALLALPGVIWYTLYRLRTTGDHQHLPDWPGWLTGIVLGAIVFSFLVPAFRVVALHDATAVGVDLVSSPITDLARVFAGLLIALAILIGCIVVGMHAYLRKIAMLGPFLAAAAFFGTYIYVYFTSSFVYYSSTLVALLKSQSYLLILPLFLLFMCTIIFYVTGFLSFLYEIWRD